MPYGGGYSDLSSKNNQLNRYNFIKNSRTGAILIEFAFAVPILFSLIYYVHDLSILKRTQSQVNFMAEIMVNVIQNISQNRTDKTITLRDLNYARATAGLAYYGGGITHYAVDETNRNWRPLGSCLVFYMYLVEGTGHNRCKVKWAIDGSLFYNTPDNISAMNRFNYQSDHSKVRYSSNDTESSSIYKSLQIEEGQFKIIIDLCIWMSPNHKMADGTSVGAVPILRRFGLYVAPPNRYKTSDSYFHSVVIFTPKPGLFSETAPK